MKERPILFSGQMVRAILEGRKTMTRRVVKLRHGADVVVTNGQVWKPARVDYAGYVDCPYGQPGDRLWVRETWAKTDGRHEIVPIAYRATNDSMALLNDKWKPSIHMPRWASRITLEITGIRVERLQEISYDDAIAEGIERIGGEFSCSPWKNYRKGQPGEMDCHCSYPPRSYQTLWESINGPGSWGANPWVWVIEFKRVNP